MMKSRRRSAILRLLDEHVVESQEQLQHLLAERGLDVTQATLSRDLRALGVVKAPLPDGGARYRKRAPGPSRDLAMNNLAAFMREVVPAGNLLVIRTLVSGAQPVGLALDQLGIPGLVGTIAGDDTVLAVVGDGHDPQTVMGHIWALIDAERSTP